MRLSSAESSLEEHWQLWHRRSLEFPVISVGFKTTLIDSHRLSLFKHVPSILREKKTHFDAQRAENQFAVWWWKGRPVSLSLSFSLSPSLSFLSLLSISLVYTHTRTLSRLTPLLLQFKHGERRKSDPLQKVFPLCSAFERMREKYVRSCPPLAIKVSSRILSSGRGFNLGNELYAGFHRISSSCLINRA